MKVSIDRSIPTSLKEEVIDDFAREILDLWEARHMYGHILTAYVQEKVPAGFILVEYNSPDTYTIRGTWVSEVFRNQGVGTKLMEMLLYAVKDSPVRVWVNITPGAEKFYEKFGFKLVGRRSDFNQTIGIFTTSDYSQDDLENLASYKYGTRFEGLKEGFFEKLKKKFKK